MKKTVFDSDEERMLRTANKLRGLVRAQVKKEAIAPALAAVARAIIPALRSLGPKIVQVLQSIPPEAWQQIGQLIVTMLQSQLGGGEGGAAAPAKNASVSPADKAIEKIAEILEKKGFSQPKRVATVLVTAAEVETEQKTPAILEASAAVEEMIRQLRILKEYA
jgi:hypothetical protein